MALGSGMLDPNEAPRNGREESSETPSDKEKELCKQIDKLFEKYAKHRKRYDKSWVDNYKYYRGQQWKKRPSYKQKDVVNLVFQAIQSQTSTMMDTRPTITFLPQEPSDLELSQILTQVLEADWEKNNWMDEVASVILDGHIYGVGYGHLCYEDDVGDGHGGIKWLAEDPFDFYPDTESRDVNKNSKAFIVAKPEDMDTVKSRYAGHKYVDLIKPDLEDLSYFKRQVETLHKRKNTDLDLSGESTSSIDGELTEQKDKVLVITAYLRPSDTEEVKEEDKDEAGETVYITRLKYPRGRKVVKINEYIFEDEPLEYDHLLFPFQRYVNYILPREFFGMSEIDQTKGPQDVFNKLVAFSIDVLYLMGNPIWKVPMEGNVNTRKLINQPGLIIEYANNAEPKREEGVQLQPYVLQMIDRMEKWFNDQAGTQDVTRGVNPTGVTANAAIENLLEQAQKRVKQKLRNLDGCLKDFGRQWLGLCFQYYTAPMVFRLTNKEEANKYFKFHVEHRDEVNELGEPVMGANGEPKKQKFAIVRDYAMNAENQLVPAESQKEYQIKGDFDVRVNTVSGLPFSKFENEQKIFNLFDRQIIDAEEVLTRLEYPNKDAILQRLAEQQAAAAQAAPPPK